VFPVSSNQVGNLGCTRDLQQIDNKTTLG
jgi:hypothetical protein